uniref:CSN8/PSMD8/EIF3K domain-containing protein n=1 Tax=Oryza meridionalis TaxID=40149 RepID=A0A0E0DI65_9ORYZ
MEGAYNQLFNARQTVPHEAYDFFIDLLAETFRDEIADCSAQAYDYLLISDAKKMLLFSCDQQLVKYISEAIQHEWDVQNCLVLFHMAKSKPPAIPSFQQIKRTISYVKELD